MKRQTKYAIGVACEKQRDPQEVWHYIVAQIGYDEASQLDRYIQSLRAKDEAIDSAKVPERWSSACRILNSADAVANWHNTGFPMVVLPDLSVALELANTDPPVWLLTSPHGEDEYATLGIEIGNLTVTAIVCDWQDGTAIWIGDNISDEPYGTDRKRVPFDPEQEQRFIANIGFVLSARPEGLEIREHRPSPKAQRKRGRKYFPKLEYIIQAPRPVHRPEPTGVERGPHAEVWTQSVRTLVRGHWRQQAHGPGYSLHKTIWIRPTWRGPEDAPISIHPLKLTAIAAQEAEPR
jgi:hypothetical protein